MKKRGLDSIDSWVVAASCSVIHILNPLPLRLGGILFVAMLDRYDTNRQSASFSLSLAFLMRSISGPFAAYFAYKFGFQRTTLVGCILCAIGVGGCYFAEDIVTVDIFLGLIYGFGIGWSTAVVPEIINSHFNKHRAKGIGIVFGGSSFGSFICPPLLEKIIDQYGVSGTFLFTSAVLLNSVPAAMLLRKPRLEENIVQGEINNGFAIKEEGCVSTIQKESIIDGSEKVSSCEIRESNKNKLTTHLNASGNNVSNYDTDIPLPTGNLCRYDISKQSEKTRNSIQSTTTPNYNILSKNTKALTYHKESGGTPVLLNACKLSDTPSIDNEKVVCTNCNDQSTGDKSVKKFSPNDSFSVLWSPVFLIITLVQSSHFYLTYMSWTIIVDVVRDKKVEDYLEVYFVMALSLFDMIGRYSLGCITDSGYMTRANFSAFCFAVMALACGVLPWVSDFATVMIVVCLLGFVCGGNTTGLPGIVTQFIHGEKRSMAMASRLILYAPMSFTMSPLIGYFRGHLGSYDGLFYSLVVLCLFCTVVLVCLPRMTCLKDTREEKEEQEHV